MDAGVHPSASLQRGAFRSLPRRLMSRLNTGYQPYMAGLRLNWRNTSLAADFADFGVGRAGGCDYRAGWRDGASWGRRGERGAPCEGTGGSRV